MSNSSITQKEINKIIEETKNLKSFKVLNQTDRNSLLCYVKINVKKPFDCDSLLQGIIKGTDQNPNNLLLFNGEYSKFWGLNYRDKEQKSLEKTLLKVNEESVFLVRLIDQHLEAMKRIANS